MPNIPYGIIRNNSYLIEKKNRNKIGKSSNNRSK